MGLCDLTSEVYSFQRTFCKVFNVSLFQRMYIHCVQASMELGI